MELEKIKQLIKLVNEEQLAEFKLVEGDSSVCIVRATSPTPPTPATPLNLQQPTPSIASHKMSNPSADEPQGYTIRSPMVGTAYLASKPDAKPFVELGQTVKAGDVLCIIEAMKMMNHITTDRTGIIKERLVSNASPVEYNQGLFTIE